MQDSLSERVSVCPHAAVSVDRYVEISHVRLIIPFDSGRDTKRANHCICGTCELTAYPEVEVDLRYEVRLWRKVHISAA